MDITLERKAHLNGLAAHLRRNIIGQDDACDILAQAFIRGELGMAKSERPKGSFLLMGPTGVGKTESVLQAASYLFGETAKDRFVRYDMAEYQAKDSIKLLLGADRDDPGRLGKDLKYLQELGGSGIILFDEIEKAHQDLSTIFLSILDAARIRLGSGQLVDFSPYYLAYTSNLGSKDMANMEQSPYTTIERNVFRAAKDHFRPEVFARFEQRLVFRPLDDAAQAGIADIMLAKERRHIKAQLGIELTWGAGVMTYLAKNGFDRLLGARPLRRAIELGVGQAVSERILDVSLPHPNALLIDYDKRADVLVARDIPEQEAMAI